MKLPPIVSEKEWKAGCEALRAKEERAYPRSPPYPWWRRHDEYGR